jgi:hypothetical protein
VRRQQRHGHAARDVARDAAEHDLASGLEPMVRRVAGQDEHVVGVPQQRQALVDHAPAGREAVVQNGRAGISRPPWSDQSCGGSR